MDDEYVEEACFYLTEINKTPEEIASQFNLTSSQVLGAVKSYKKKIESGSIKYDDDAKDFWSTIQRESSGDEKITMVDEKGRYYHGWKSEIEKLPTKDLVELLVINKQYSDKHPLSNFSKTQPVVGYDPIVPLRSIRHTVSIIDSILQKREVDEDSTGES